MTKLKTNNALSVIMSFHKCKVKDYKATKCNYVFQSMAKLTSRCPYRAFGRHFRVSFVMVKSCPIMLLMSNHVIDVKSCYSCKFMFFMSNHVIHVKSSYLCQIMSFIVTIYVIHVTIHIPIHVIHVKIHVHWSSNVS
jgi:hypothetical protein